MLSLWWFAGTGSAAAFGQEPPEVESYIAGVNDFLADQDDIVTPDDDLPENPLPDNSITPLQASPPDYSQRDSWQRDTRQTPSIYQYSPSSPAVDPVVGAPARDSSVSNSNDLTAIPSTIVNDRAEYDFTSSQPASRDYFEPQVAPDAIWLLGFNGLVFNRNLDDDKVFGFDAANPADVQLASNSDGGYTGGVEGTIARRNSRGYGWEARYFGVYGDESQGLLGGTPQTSIPRLSTKFRTSVLVRPCPTPLMPPTHIR